ncbi:hypothetical protein ACOSQ3_006600 [Xanthoceras sorbifolium]
MTRSIISRKSEGKKLSPRPPRRPQRQNRQPRRPQRQNRQPRRPPTSAQAAGRLTWPNRPFPRERERAA